MCVCVFNIAFNARPCFVAYPLVTWRLTTYVQLDLVPTGPDYHERTVVLGSEYYVRFVINAALQSDCTGVYWLLADSFYTLRRVWDGRPT